LEKTRPPELIVNRNFREGVKEFGRGVKIAKLRGNEGD